jgi:hypothetical protein
MYYKRIIICKSKNKDKVDISYIFFKYFKLFNELSYFINLSNHLSFNSLFTDFF